ncbi:DUF4192 domain-containing protein [Isoptericola aurantiacus]|uniref:DUF4192 domain-containing protein n=1 Tax=Isoptericola aurantiacus TaxID=3377839 RepID=UPI00383B59B0
MTSIFDTDPLTVPLCTAHDVLAAIPYQLGFRPSESVVLACATADDRLGLVARVDLEDLRGPGAAEGLEPLARALAESRPVYCALVLYTAGEPARADAALDAVRAAVGPLVALDAWVVTPDGYRGLGCEDPTCCPPGGHPISALDHGTVAAASVLSGQQVAASREEAFRIPRAPDDARALTGRAARRSERALHGAPDEASRRDWREGALSSWIEATRRAGTGATARRPAESSVVRPPLLGRVAAALADRRVRDAALLTLVPDAEDAARATVRGAASEAADEATARALAQVVDPDVAVVPDPAQADRARVVLEQVVAHAPRRLHAPALTLLAFLAWWQGDGPRASYRVGEALAVDDTYRLAHLVQNVVVAALPPGWVRASDAGRVVGAPSGSVPPWRSSWDT